MPQNSVVSAAQRVMSGAKDCPDISTSLRGVEVSQRQIRAASSAFSTVRRNLGHRLALDRFSEWETGRCPGCPGLDQRPVVQHNRLTVSCLQLQPARTDQGLPCATRIQGPSEGVRGGPGASRLLRIAVRWTTAASGRRVGRGVSAAIWLIPATRLDTTTLYSASLRVPSQGQRATPSCAAAHLADRSDFRERHRRICVESHIAVITRSAIFLDLKGPR